MTRLSGQSASGAATSAKGTESATSLFLYITVPDTYTLNIAGLSGTAKKKVHNSYSLYIFAQMRLINRILMLRRAWPMTSRWRARPTSWALSLS